MRIYSDKIDSPSILRRALLDVLPECPDVTMEIVSSTNKARVRRNRFDVYLAGTGTRHHRPRNGGRYGSSQDYAATWMDWGWFIAVLFRYDPDAVIGQYKGRGDFLRQTARDANGYRSRDKSVKNFARNWAAHWRVGEGCSPFVLVDKVCPIGHLYDSTDPEQVIAWLEAS